jgi:beta-galactosidase
MNRVAPLLVCLLCVPTLAAVTVRVLETPGGPQIHVNGEPVPPRFFWGAPSASPLGVTGEWQDYAFDFEPGLVDGGGTLHFRFPQQPGRVWLADVRITNAATGADVLPAGSFATP